MNGKLLSICTGALLCTNLLNAKELQHNKGKLLLEEKFDGEVSSKVFKGNIGTWKVVEGAIHGNEEAKDNHPAAARITQLTKDAVYEFKFRITKDGKTFNCGFDPAKGELEKKGHLWAVTISGKKWSISKAPDKNKPKEDPAKTLATGEISIEKDKWYTMKIVSLGNKVSVTVDDNTLNAEHESFHVKKPTLIFRCKGDGIEIDDVKIWEAN